MLSEELGCRLSCQHLPSFAATCQTQQLKLKHLVRWYARGRPALLGVDDAYYDILRVVRTGMQCGAAFAQRPRSLTSRSSRPCTNGSKRDASALPTNVSSGCIGGVGGLATVASIPHLSIISMAWTASVGCKHFGELTEGHRTLYNHHLIRRCNRSGLAIYCG